MDMDTFRVGFFRFTLIHQSTYWPRIPLSAYLETIINHQTSTTTPPTTTTTITTTKLARQYNQS